MNASANKYLSTMLELDSSSTGQRGSNLLIFLNNAITDGGEPMKPVLYISSSDTDH